MAPYNFVLSHCVLRLIAVLRGKSTIGLLVYTESLSLSLLLQVVIYSLFALKYVDRRCDCDYSQDYNC